MPNLASCCRGFGDLLKKRTNFIQKTKKIMHQKKLEQIEHSIGKLTDTMDYDITLPQ